MTQKSVSRKQRYNTLDFAEQNRVPTGMLAPLLETQRQREYSLCNPSFSSRVHIQTAKMQLAMSAQKTQKEVRTDELRTSFFADNLKL